MTSFTCPVGSASEFSITQLPTYSTAKFFHPTPPVPPTSSAHVIPDWRGFQGFLLFRFRAMSAITAIPAIAPLPPPSLFLPRHPSASQFGVGLSDIRQRVAAPKTQIATESPLRGRAFAFPNTKYQILTTCRRTYPTRFITRRHARTSSPAPVTALCDPLLNGGTCF